MRTPASAVRESDRGRERKRDRERKKERKREHTLLTGQRETE